MAYVLNNGPERTVKGLVAEQLVPEHFTLSISFSDGTSIATKIQPGTPIGELILDLSAFMDTLLQAFKEDRAKVTKGPL